MNSGDVRVRELTPRGRGGVSVLAVEGEGAARRVAALVAGFRAEAGSLSYARLEHARESLDEALVVVRGDHYVEVHAHGSPPLVARLRELLGGDHRAQSERLTLEQRAWSRLAGAPCEAAARILLDQAEGALRGELESAANEESSLAIAHLRALAERGRRARFALEPARVVIAGPVNAGKSTLFNALVGERRAIVASEPGTTRDALSGRALLGAWPFDCFDTAGEREPASDAPAGDVEAAGVHLARELRASADVVLWLETEEERAPPEPIARTLRIHSCADRMPASRRRQPWIAARDDPGGAASTVGELLRSALELPVAAWESGEGVPFERDQIDALTRLAAETDPALRAKGIADLLAALSTSSD